MSKSRVRFIGSRELHRDLPKVLESLENPNSRFVLTIHSKPKAVLIGAEAFLALLRGHSPEDRLLALQLGALVQGLESARPPKRSTNPARAQPRKKSSRSSEPVASLSNPIRPDLIRPDPDDPFPSNVRAGSQRESRTALVLVEVFPRPSLPDLSPGA